MRLLLNEKWRGIGLALLAAALAFAVYAPSIGYDYVALDDDVFVSENPVVNKGFSVAAVQAAWTTAPEANCLPLLWMSYMADVELFGLKPWGFHLTNVFLFALNVGVLFGLVRRWTGRAGVAWAVVLLWMFHPARLESVVWITERKDVLSGLFFLLGIGAYVEGRRGTLRHGVLLAWVCMVLGGLSKQILIVMPVALTLLDVWPLGRTDWDRMGRDVWRLTLEKWAFWLVAFALAFLPVWLHHIRGAMLDVSWGYRLSMIPIHYLFYFQKLLWPTELMPLQDELPFRWGALMGGLGVLLGGTWALWRIRKRQPWALMGWLWFIALLFPLTGVVWGGAERLATRFMYLPQIGLTLGGVLVAAEFVRGRGGKGRWGAVLCAGVILAYGVQIHRMFPHWRDEATFSEAVWTYNRGHEAACLLGGDCFMLRGDWARAEEAYALGTMKWNKKCFARLCLLRIWCGQAEGAAHLWRTFEETTGTRVLDFKTPDNPEEQRFIWSIRGQILRAQGELDAALAAFEEALRLEPDPAAFIVAEFLRTCHEAGRPEAGAAAAARLEAAKGLKIRAWPDLLPRYLQFWLEGGRGLAYGYFAEYARRHPADGQALNNMAWLLATAEPDGLNHAGMEEWPATAVAWAERALEAGGQDYPGVWDTLAAARANAGDFAGAIGAAERGLALAKRTGDWMLASKLEARLERYRAGQPWREADKRATQGKE